MKYTYLQYEFRNKWFHVAWCKKFFASDDEHFDRLRNAIFGIKAGTQQLIYSEAAARLQRKELTTSQRIMSLYASLGACSLTL